MPTVSFTRNLQRHVACQEMFVSGATVREALEAVFGQQANLRGYLLDDQGALRQHMAIFVNGRQVGDRKRLSDPCATGTHITIMQALSGG